MANKLAYGGAVKVTRRVKVLDTVSPPPPATTGQLLPRR